MSIQHDGKWEVGKENTVTITFKPLVEVKHRKNYPDEAGIVFDSGLVYVSGDTNWSGYLEKDRQYSISVILRPIKSGKFVVGVGVKSCLSKIFSDEELSELQREGDRLVQGSPELNRKGWKSKYPKKVFMYHNGTSAIIEVKGAMGIQADTIWHETDGVRWRHIRTSRPLDSLRGPRPVLTDSNTSPLRTPVKDSGSIERQSGTQSSFPYHITGTFRYLNNWGIYQPMRDAYIEAAILDPYYGFYTEYTQTDDEGYFEIWAYGISIMCYVYAYTPGGWVFYGDGHFDCPGDVFEIYGWGFSAELDGDWNVPSVVTSLTDIEISGAYEIADLLRTGYSYFGGSPPPFSNVYWDVLDATAPTRFLATCIIVENSNPIIIIQSRAVDPYGAGRDEWDANVVLHEYSHFIEWAYAESPPSSGGPHRYWYPASLPSQIPRRVAYTEGWANFFQGAILGAPAYVDRDNNNSTVLEYNFERPSPDAPYIDASEFNNLYQTAPSHSEPVYLAYEVEGAIIEALWDLYDLADDGNYYQSGYLYGHNNDYNQNDYWRGIQSIWNVFAYYGPAPSDFDHDHPWDFHEFIAGWEELGYPVAGHFTDILNSHSLQICVAIPGDANASGDLSLGDVIAITNYVFNKPGCSPPPICWLSGLLCRGDWNASGDVSLGDIIQAVNYVYNKPGGPWDPLSSDVCCLPVPSLFAARD